MHSGQFGRLGKHSTVYGLTSVLGASATLVLLPLLTRHLSPVEYGMLEVLTVFSAQLSVLLQLGLGSALFKFAVRDGQGKFDNRTVVSTVFWTTTGVAFVATTALVPMAPQVSQVLLGNREYATEMRWLLIKVWFDAVCVVPMVRLRIREESIVYGVLNASRVFVSLGFVALALTMFDGGLTSILIAMAAESGLFALVGAASAVRDLASPVVARTLRPMLAFGLPLIPYAFALTILALGDRYFLSRFGNFEDVGRYAVGSKLGAILAIPVRAFQVAWPGLLFSQAKAPNARSFYAKVLTYLLLVLGFIGVSVSVFAKELMALLATSEFAAGYVVVPILVMAQICLGAFYATAVGTNLTGKTYLQTASAGIALIVFGVAAMFLVPPLGMIGAAVATALGYFTLAAADCVFSLQLYPVPYEWRRIAMLLLVAGTLTGAGMSIDTGHRVANVAIKVVVVSAYPALLHAFGFFAPGERRALRALLARVVGASRPDSGEAIISEVSAAPGDVVKGPL